MPVRQIDRLSIQKDVCYQKHQRPATQVAPKHLSVNLTRRENTGVFLSTPFGPTNQLAI
jgi:hypothetical protein